MKIIKKAGVTSSSVTAALGFTPRRKAGVVTVTFADGTQEEFVPSANTDAARGLALEAAMAVATAWSTVDLSPGNYDVAKATSTVIAVATHYSVLAGMTIRLNGARLYHGAGFNGAVFFGADAVDDWSLIGPGRIEGTGTASTTPPSGTNEIGLNCRTCRRWRVQNISFQLFKNVGMQVNNSSYIGHGTTLSANLKISTGIVIGCNFDYNKIGMANYAGSEYISFSGCTFNNNATACDINAGNTKFVGCEVSGNANYGLLIRNGGNDGHGCFVGGHITHNVGFAIYAEASMDAGFLINGTTIGGDSGSANKIESAGGGLNLVNCYVESPFYAASTATGLNFMTGCFIAGTYTVTTDLSSAERLKWVFEGNYTLTGGWAQNDTQIYVFADNAAAITGGLTAGRRYRKTTTNEVCEVV